MSMDLPVSDYPDWLEPEDENIDRGEIEQTNEICPTCLKGKLNKWYESDGIDDFKEVLSCPNCGERFDE